MIGGLNPGEATGRAGESTDVAILQTEDLDVLDTAQRLLGDLEAFLVRLHSQGAESADIAAQHPVDEAIRPAQEQYGNHGYYRFDRHQQCHKKEGSDTVGQQVHGGHQRIVDDQANLGEDRFTKVGAVPVQKEAVRPPEVAAQQAAAQGVVAHVGKARHGPVGQRLEGEAADCQHEDGAAEEQQEGIGAGEAKAVVDGIEVLAGLHHFGVGDHGDERHHRGDADDFQQAHDQHHAEQQNGVAALAGVQEVADLAVGF